VQPAGSASRASSSAGRGASLSSSPSFEELRNLTAQLNHALTDTDTAGRHAALLQRHIARMQRRRRRHLANAMAAAAHLQECPPSAHSAFRGPVPAADGDGPGSPLHSDQPPETSAVEAAPAPAEESGAPCSSGSNSGSSGAAATLRELVGAVGALSQQLAAAAGERYASASLLSDLLGSPAPGGAAAALPSPLTVGSCTAAGGARQPEGSPAAAQRSPEVRRAARRVRAIASGLQVSSAAQLGAARASEALQRDALALTQELRGLGRSHRAAAVEEALADEGSMEIPTGGGGESDGGSGGGLLASFDSAAREELAAGEEVPIGSRRQHRSSSDGSGASGGERRRQRVAVAPEAAASSATPAPPEAGEPSTTCSALLRAHQRQSADVDAVRQRVAGGAPGFGFDAPEASSSPRLDEQEEEEEEEGWVGECSLGGSCSSAGPGLPTPSGSSGMRGSLAGLLPAERSGSSAGGGMRGSFAFGTPRDASSPASSGPSVSISFSGFGGGSSGGPHRSARRPGSRRQRQSSGGGSLLSLAESSCDRADASGEGGGGGAGSLAFATPSWLQQLAGCADAATQTSPAATAAANVQTQLQQQQQQQQQHVAPPPPPGQVEGRLLVLQQRLQEAELRARIGADTRDALQAALAAAQDQLQQQQQQQVQVTHTTPQASNDPHLFLPASPRQLAAPAPTQLRDLQEQCLRQAARIEQLQLALAAATAVSSAAPPPPPGSLGTRSRSGSRSGFRTPGSGSLTSTPSKSPQRFGGGSGAILPLRERLVGAVPLLPLHHLAQQQEQHQEQQAEAIGARPATASADPSTPVKRTSAANLSPAAADFASGLAGLPGLFIPQPGTAGSPAARRHGSSTPDSCAQLSPRGTGPRQQQQQQSAWGGAPSFVPRSTAPPLLSPRRTMPPSPRLMMAAASPEK
jgi:hypothetical protein